MLALRRREVRRVEHAPPEPPAVREHKPRSDRRGSEEAIFVALACGRWMRLREIVNASKQDYRFVATTVGRLHDEGRLKRRGTRMYYEYRT